MQISPTTTVSISPAEARPTRADAHDVRLTPVRVGEVRPPLLPSAPFPVPTNLADPAYLADYLRLAAQDAPQDSDFARVYHGDRLVGRIHNSGAATLYGIGAPADWATDTSGRQGPAEAQRRADQFKALGYRTVRADTALSAEAWRPPAAVFQPEAFEAYARLRRSEEAQTRGSGLRL